MIMLKIYKVIQIFLLSAGLVITCSCSNEGKKEDALKTASSFDSCTIAKPFEMARTLEASVAAGYTGVQTNYWGGDTTKIDFQHFFEHGKLVKSIFYFENGRVQEEYHYKCGALHGYHLVYYDNGRLKQSAPFSYGYLQGTGKLFDRRGNMIEELTFTHDSLAEKPKVFNQKADSGDTSQKEN